MVILSFNWCFRLADDVDAIFNVKVLLNFVTSSIVICASGLLMMISENVIETCRFFIAFVLFISQTFFICFLGDQLTVAVSTFCINLHF